MLRLVLGLGLRLVCIRRGFTDCLGIDHLELICTLLNICQFLPLFCKLGAELFQLAVSNRTGHMEEPETETGSKLKMETENGNKWKRNLQDATGCWLIVLTHPGDLPASTF